MNITFKQLLVFVAIARHGSMTSASQASFMTKGAMSQALAELESQLGVRLFDRRHARLFINYEGHKLLPVADELLARMQGIEQLFIEQGVHKQLTVGCTKTIGNYLLPDMLTQFERDEGWLPQPMIANTQVISRMLKNFEIDVALLEGPAMERELVCEPWMDDEMVVIAAKNHPLANAGTISYARLSQERWILRELGSSSRTFFENHLALKLETSEVVLSLNAFEAILSCVRNNLGITFISRRLFQQPCYTEHYSQVYIEQRFMRKLTFCYHRGKFISPTLLDWKMFSQNWAKNFQYEFDDDVG